MSGQDYTSLSQSIPFRKNAGGLNSTFSPPNLEDNESSDLLNIDFDKSGAIVKRNGYAQLNTTAIPYGGIDSYTKFLCHCDGTTTSFVDTIGTHTINNVGPGATQSATQYKFGGKSGFFDGNNDYLYLADHADFTWTTGIFTFDCWAYYDDAALADGVIFYKGTDADNYMKLQLNSDGSVTFKIVTATVTKVTISSAAASMVIRTMTHIEVGGDGSKYYLFINGAAVAPVTDADKPLDYTLPFNIGSVEGGGTYWKGYLDEIRISKGICRHTTAFTVPTIAYNAETASPSVQGLKWLERSDGNDYLIAVAGTNIYSATALTPAAAPFTGRTGAITITTGQNNQINWCTYLDYAIGTNGVDLPFKCNGSADASALAVPTGLTTAKFCEVFANHVFLGNVTVSGVVQSSRVYWYEIDSVSSILDTSYRNVNQFDGQDITGLKTFGGSLVIFKHRSIWIANFTGDSDIPFVFQQTRSAVGCDAPLSIQEVEGGLIFHSYDGYYMFDGNNSYKMSYRITSSLNNMATTRFSYMPSIYLFNKNRYISAVTYTGGSQNDLCITWDSFNNAFSLYDGIAANCFSRVYSSGQEYIYFGDYHGFVYKMDTGASDYPLGTATAIDSYYYTKWFDFGDLVSKKANPQLAIYHQYEAAQLTLTYSYNYNSGDDYSQLIDFSGTGGTWPITWGTTLWSSSGGSVKKRHLTGRGEVVRFGFKNNIIGQGFTVNGFGIFAHAETNIK
jgi:hypothetical protein